MFDISDKEIVEVKTELPQNLQDAVEKLQEIIQYTKFSIGNSYIKRLKNTSHVLYYYDCENFELAFNMCIAESIGDDWRKQWLYELKDSYDRDIEYNTRQYINIISDIYMTNIKTVVVLK